MNQKSCNILSITFHWNFARRYWILNIARRWTWIWRRGREDTRRWSTENSPPSTPLKSPANLKTREKSYKFETVQKFCCSTSSRHHGHPTCRSSSRILVRPPSWAVRRVLIQEWRVHGTPGTPRIMVTIILMVKWWWKVELFTRF